MKGTTLRMLLCILISFGITTGCQQDNKRPRLDTTNLQTFNKSLQQVRTQVDEAHLKQFDRAIQFAQHNYEIQQQYGLLPSQNPLNGLTAEQVLELPTNRQRQVTRRLQIRMSI